MQLNKWLQLEPFPDDAFRNAIMLVLVLDIVAAFVWDRLMLLIFAPKILWASVEGTTVQDGINALKVVAICYGIIYFLATVSEACFFLSEVVRNCLNLGWVAVRSCRTAVCLSLSFEVHVCGFTRAPTGKCTVGRGAAL